MTSDRDPAPKFASFFGDAWIVLSLVVGLVLLGMFYFGPWLMHIGGVIWALIRWIFSPII
jgi:hypothetical protein